MAQLIVRVELLITLQSVEAPAPGSFTTLNSSSLATLASLTCAGTSTLTTVDINGGAIDGTAIGANSASTVAATTVTASKH